MRGIQPSEAVRKTMNHDVATGRDSPLSRFLLILLIGIRHVDRLVETAISVAAIEYVVTLRSLVVSLLLFGANRRTSELLYKCAKPCPAKVG